MFKYLNNYFRNIFRQYLLPYSVHMESPPSPAPVPVKSSLEQQVDEDVKALIEKYRGQGAVIRRKDYK